MVTPSLRPYILEAKQRLQEGYLSLRQKHQAGGGGLEISREMTALWDQTIKTNYRRAVEEILPDESQRSIFLRSTSLVGLGGYGRQDVAPYSDVDLMLLYFPGVAEIEKVAGRLVQDGFDVGLKLALSTRTLREACTQAFTDPTILTSFTETRLLDGSASLVEKFHDRFLRQVRRKMHWSMDYVEKSRKVEQDRFAEPSHDIIGQVSDSRASAGFYFAKNDIVRLDVPMDQILVIDRLDRFYQILADQTHGVA